MKQVVSISLGPKAADYEFETEFLGHDFSIRRLGTDGDPDKVLELLLKWDGKADAIGLGSMKFPNAIGPKHVLQRRAEKLRMLSERVKTPVTMGSALRSVVHEWSLRHVEFVFGNYFDNARVLFFSGLANHKIARVMSEFTENLTFADPILENGISKFIKSVKDLELYASGVHEILKWAPTKKFSANFMPARLWNIHLLRKAMQQAQVIVTPHYDFYRYLEHATLEELGGKTIITSCAYDDRVTFLQERGVDVIIDTAPKILEKVVGLNVLEAMMLAALGKKQDQIIDDDLLEIISDQNMAPRVVYPSGTPKRVNRFAFVIHPLSQEFLKKEKAVDIVSQFAPPLNGAADGKDLKPPFQGQHNGLGQTGVGHLGRKSDIFHLRVAGQLDFTGLDDQHVRALGHVFGRQVQGTGHVRNHAAGLDPHDVQNGLAGAGSRRDNDIHIRQVAVRPRGDM